MIGLAALVRFVLAVLLPFAELNSCEAAIQLVKPVPFLYYTVLLIYLMHEVRLLLIGRVGLG